METASSSSAIAGTAKLDILITAAAVTAIPRLFIVFLLLMLCADDQIHPRRYMHTLRALLHS